MVDDFGQFLQNGVEVVSFVCAESSWYVFPNSESWINSSTLFPHFSYNSYGFNKQPASDIIETKLQTSLRKPLARATKSDAVHKRRIVNFCDVSKVLQFLHPILHIVVNPNLRVLQHRP